MVRKKGVKNKTIKKLGGGNITLGNIIRHVSKSSVTSIGSPQKLISLAIKGTRGAIKQNGGKKSVKVPQVLPLAAKKIGKALPLIPIFAGLSAIGALAGGASGVVKAINDTKIAHQQLEESQRHNKTIEAIAMGKGLYLKPYKKGYGLYLKPYVKEKGAGLRKKKA